MNAVNANLSKISSAYHESHSCPIRQWKKNPIKANSQTYHLPQQC